MRCIGIREQLSRLLKYFFPERSEVVFGGALRLTHVPRVARRVPYVVGNFLRIPRRKYFSNLLGLEPRILAH